MSLALAVTELSATLREQGVRVSTSEVEAALTALACVGLERRARVEAALRATLIKREADVPLFAPAFESVFSGAGALLARLERSLIARIEEEGLLRGDELTMVVATLGALLPSMGPVAQAILGGDGAGAARLLSGAVLALDLRGARPGEAGFYARRLLQSAGIGKVASQLSAINQELSRRGAGPQAVQHVARHLRALMGEVEEALRGEVEQRVQRRADQAEATLGRRPLAQLERTELESVESSVRRIGERLRTRLARRDGPRRRGGSLNAHATLRENLGTGGVPAVPIYRKRRALRPELFVLCDVSESVQHVSRLTLLLTHCLQSLFVRVRSFVFVAELVEVTDAFKRLSLESALEEAVTGRGVTARSNSSYASALGRFLEEHGSAVSRRSTVLIIGDGRSNYQGAATQSLEALIQRARRVLWLCPEPRERWGAADSDMPAYARLCHGAFPVTSLDELARVADRLHRA